MTTSMHLPGLQIDSPLVAPDAVNFRPPTWPPPADFPVVIDAEGLVVCVYGDAAWNLAVWAGTACNVPFGDGGGRSFTISPGNADLLRQLAGWWLWGRTAVQNPKTLKCRVAQIRQLAAVCSAQGILISELTRFPKVIDAVAAGIRASDGLSTLSLLHRLLAVREALGFVILDEGGIRRLAAKLPGHNRVQTAYIPPRIWTYQVIRSREFLDDYLAHKDQVSACYAFCLEAYRANAGSWAALFEEGLSRDVRPFSSAPSARVAGRGFYGPFRDTAKRFGIEGLIQRWVGDDAISGLSTLLNTAREVGLSYTLTFSLMRVDEGAQLRAGCYTIEQDTLNQDVHLLASVTSKTQQDPDARWICSPSVSVAIEAMTHVALLRLTAAKHNPHRRLSALDRTNPRLWSWAEEPWSRGGKTKGERGRVLEYATAMAHRSKVFEAEQLRTTSTDLEIAQSMTFGLDPNKFAVGQVWPFAWHQLRRTGVCNMLASGLVSEASVRYQLKHLTVVMTRYYGQNYFRLKGELADEARGFFLQQMYQAVARGFAELTDGRYISPHGEKRKDQIIRPITESDHNGLVKAAEAGAITYRETLLGGCTQITCVYGGVTNIAACMGTAGESSKPCDNLIINKARRPILIKLLTELECQLGQAPSNSPKWRSITANRIAVEAAIDVIEGC